MSFEKKLTKQQIKRYSSTFLDDLIHPKKKDLFKIDEIEKNSNVATCRIKINQQKTHPFSEDGFHLSAVPVCEFIDLFIRKLYEEQAILNLMSLEMFCNRPVRKKTINPDVIIDVNKVENEQKSQNNSNKNLKVSFNIENKSFDGIINYDVKNHMNLINVNYKTSSVELMNNTFEILDLQVDGLKSYADLNFISNTISHEGFVLGPGLALTICSQLVIIHTYAISAVKKKNKGVVVSDYKYFCKENIRSPNMINYKSKIKNISPSKKSHKYIKIIVDCYFNNGDCKAELTYYFDPF